VYGDLPPEVPRGHADISPIGINESAKQALNTSPGGRGTPLLIYYTLLPSYALYTVIPCCPLPAVGSAERSGPSGPLL
jgi:hypothetical protein